MTSQYSTIVGIVRNRADRALVVSAMSGAVLKNNSFPLPAVAIDEKGQRELSFSTAPLMVETVNATGTASDNAYISRILYIYR